MPKKFPKLKSKILLAPMHEITNLPFRLMCREYGAGLTSTGLLSANAIARENKSALKSALTDKKEKPIVAQIFGQNTENLVKTAKILEKDFDIIDINFGCPSDKIVKQGAGGYLMKRKNKILEIVQKVSESIKIPLTIKIRSGYDKSSINALEIAKLCEPYISGVIIHPRTVDQGYAGKADWEIIKKIKQAVKIPVIGNGDVTDPESCQEMLKQTNCDYVMIGRAAIGNPFLFKQINNYIKTKQIINQSKEEKINDFFKYLRLCEEFNLISSKDARQRAHEFTKGLEGGARLRRELNTVKNLEKIKLLIKEFIK